MSSSGALEPKPMTTSSNTIDSSSSAAAIIASITTDNEEDDFIITSPTNDIELDWDMTADADIPKVGDESAEEGWESVRIATALVQSSLSGEDDYVGDDLTSTTSQLEIIAQLKDVYNDTVAAAKHCEDWDEDHLIEEFRKRADAMDKAMDTLTRYMEA